MYCRVFICGLMQLVRALFAVADDIHLTFVRQLPSAERARLILRIQIEALAFRSNGD